MRRASATTPHDNLEILIGQLVNLVTDGEPVRMSKRAGTIIDAARTWSRRSASTPPATRWPAPRPTRTIDIDLDLLTKRSNDNPVYYVQYAHARTCNVRRLRAWRTACAPRTASTRRC